MMAQKKVSPRDLKYVESLDDVVVVKDATSSPDILIEYPDTAELQYLLGVGFADFKWSCDSAEDKVYDLVQKEEDFTVDLYDEDFIVLEDEGVETFMESRGILDSEKFVEGVNALCKEAIMAYVEGRTLVDEVYDIYSLDFDYDSDTAEVSGHVCSYTYDDYRFDRRKEERYF